MFYTINTILYAILTYIAVSNRALFKYSNNIRILEYSTTALVRQLQRRTWTSDIEHRTLPKMRKVRSLYAEYVHIVFA